MWTQAGVGLFRSYSKPEEFEQDQRHSGVGGGGGEGLSKKKTWLPAVESISYSIWCEPLEKLLALALAQS